MTEDRKKPKRPTLTVLNSELDPPPHQSAPSEDTTDQPNPFLDTQDKPKNKGEIFAGCQVQALGVQGSTYFYLDMLGQLRAITRHDKEAINGLFSSQPQQLYVNFPRYNKDGDLSGWDGEGAREAMMRACSEKGVWNAFERVRGPGAWLDDDGGIILHSGDGVFRKNSWKITGEIEGFVYPAAPRLKRPSDFGNDCLTAAGELIDLLETWNWQNGGIDPQLVLGWICAAMVGGALKWRPMAWISGDAGMGKSTLQELIHDILGGDGASLRATDATEAALRQMIGQSSIPVCLDEQEASGNNAKVDNIVKLARQASSGGLILRGGADHKGQSFMARNCFLFSSILVPPLKDQDLSRIAVLNLLRLRKGAIPPRLIPSEVQQLGARLKAQILANWGHFRDTLALYQAELAREGYTARAQDQYGTLLAMADLVSHPDPATQERVEKWVGSLQNAVQSQQDDQTAGYEKMLAHLMQQPVNTIKGGSQVLVGELVEAAIRSPMEDDVDQLISPDKARRELQRLGLRAYGVGEAAQLAIANSHTNLATYFETTRWKDGVWKQDCARIPGFSRTTPISYGAGLNIRSSKFPLASIPHFFADKTTPEPSQAATAPQSSDLNDFM
ncbi:hypothetical protein [Roseobacter sp. N2S]|uniref:hypothetical protein n=1 Tax=Roseobacter sp. N2S TaxID=2663844 RepID=UPI002855BC80|nr:hypothetical protein [Roseobacter sp. N2S]MDR6266553.1 hypothetical protein [Roseobacter sp. N2S]